jgi:hypothetical protein
MSTSRGVTRILTTYDEAKLASLGVKCLLALGGTFAPPGRSPAFSEQSITSPNGLRFTLAVLGSRSSIDSFQIELITQRLKDAPRPVLLITNSNVSMNPTDRPLDLSIETYSEFLKNGVMSWSAREIYAAYKEALSENKTALWGERESLWHKVRTGAPA